MASRAVVRSLASLSGLGKFSRDLKASPRTFAAQAARVQGGQVEQKENQAATPRSRPLASFPDAFSAFSPVTSLLQMMDTMDRVFDGSLLSPISSTPRIARSSTRMPWDVMEDEKAFKLRMDMPGLSKEEVKIAVEDGDLTVKGEHKAEENEGDWSSRSLGSYNIRIKLPENVDPNGIKAELKNGVLKVEAPKIESKKEKLTVRLD